MTPSSTPTQTSTPTPTILILNGPNLNVLGSREPGIYGRETLAQIAMDCEEKASALGLAIDFVQTNDEGAMVTFIQKARGTHQGVIINAGGYTHTSVAIHDALKILEIPVIEVHLSNIYAREEFRHKSYVAPLAKGTLCGFGGFGYSLALEAMKRLLDGGGAHDKSDTHANANADRRKGKTHS